MSCNGCRVLRKGCSESCILRPCLQWIDSPEAQGHATVFVAKFFGRAGLMSFISAVPESQRPALFQSLLFEACGRTVNPVNGAVGLLWTGNWHVCQEAAETVLRGGALRPMSEEVLAGIMTAPESDEASEAEMACADGFKQSQDPFVRLNQKGFDDVARLQAGDLDLSLTPDLPNRVTTGGGVNYGHAILRPATPSMNSEESVMTNWDTRGSERKLLNLFI